MKKIITTMAVLAVTFMGSSVHAAGAVDSGSFTSGTLMDGNDCMLLTGSVTPSLSANVHAGFRCSEAYGIIQVGACHEGGSRDASTVDCAIVLEIPNVITVYNDASCTSVSDTFELADRRYFSMTSSGGALATASLGSDVACDDAQVAATIESLSQ